MRMLVFTTGIMPTFYRKILFYSKFFFFKINFFYHTWVHISKYFIPLFGTRRWVSDHLRVWRGQNLPFIDLNVSINISQILLFVCNTGIYKPCFLLWNPENLQPWNKQFSPRQQHNCYTFAIISNCLLWLPVSWELVKSWSLFNQRPNLHS